MWKISEWVQWIIYLTVKFVVDTIDKVTTKKGDTK